jgi:uncharacterized protein
LKAEPLTSTQKERLREGLVRFNRGDFFECHEILEAVWLEASGEDKIFLQGLIQVAVSFYHLRRRNFAGSSRLLRAGLEKLSRSSQCSQWIDAASLRQDLRPILEQTDSEQASPDTPAPVIRFIEELQ